MNGIPELIVGILLVPVTVFILIPLAMLAVWLLVKFLKPAARASGNSVRPGDVQIIKPNPSLD